MTAIVTLTPSAAIDQTYLLDRLRLGFVNRANTAHRELSGKGVNVARALAAAGIPVRAVLAVGDHDQAMVSELDFTGLLRIVDVPGHTRVNTTIVGDNAVTTKVNERSLPVESAVWRRLCEATIDELDCADASWLVLCGSVPEDAQTGELVSFAPVVDAAVARGIHVAVDTSGPALARLIDDLSGITLIKPNTHELAEVTGRSLRTVGDVTDAARALCARGCRIVYVSMGEDGALAVTNEGVWWSKAIAPALVNSTGAGDASLAGFLAHTASGSPGISAQVRDAEAPGGSDTPDGSRSGAHDDIDVAQALAGAASWGALAVSQPTTLLADIADAPQATTVADPDPATVLADPAVIHPDGPEAGIE